MQRTFFPILSLTIAGLLMAGRAEAAPAAADRGRDLVIRNCSMCHATGVTGDSPRQGAPRFRELHLRYPIEDLAEALAEGILTGHRDMPEFVFSPDEIKDIIRYLDSIQTREGADAGRAGAAVD